MKKHNKSKIMKLAHHMKKHEGYTMSQALTLAWDKARRSEFYLIIEVHKPRNIKSKTTMSYESVNSYYSNRAYSGD